MAVGDVLDFFRDQRNIQVVGEAQLDPRLTPAELFFLGRTPVQDADDHEMRARWRGRAVIADMIPLDSPSVMYKMLEIQRYETEIPKIKYGTYLLESEFRKVLELGRAQLAATGQVPDFVRRLLVTLSRQLTLGLQWRKESLIIASLLNSSHYSRMGVQIEGDWGKSSDMIVTPAVPFTDETNALPITVITSQIDYARIKRGTRLNRLICSTACFDAMAATDEFKAKAAFFLPSTLTFENLPVGDRDTLLTLFKRATRIEEVVFHDAHYEWEDVDATTRQRVRHTDRLMPINAIILDDTANDNNPLRRYLGNAIVTESAFIGRVGARQYSEGEGPPEAGGVQRGPFYYTTVGPELDPPSIRARVVQNCWPLLPDPNSNAVIWAGDIEETIAIDLTEW